MRFAKGHGTENDFVIIPDPGGEVDLTPGLVARLCDRRAGLGADGVLRAVRVAGTPGAGPGPAAAAGPAAGASPAGDVPDEAGREADYDLAEAAAAGAGWFMDYRNADGSVAEMCGNGIRVFGRYLLDHDLVTGPEFAVATRAGTRLVRAEPDGEITVDMGPPQVLGDGRAAVSGEQIDGLRISLGNPHLACVVDTPLAEFDLSEPPEVDAGQFPDGVNVELVRIIGDAHLLMRVHERGSGATRSCGTGAVAAAVAAALATPGPDGPAAGEAAAAGGTPPAANGAPAANGVPAGHGPPAGGSAAAADMTPPDAGMPAGAVPAPAGGDADPLPAYPRPPSPYGDTAAAPPPGTWIVDVPGGRLRVTLDGQTSLLSGPAVIVAEGELSEAWLSGKPVIPAQSSPAA